MFTIHSLQMSIYDHSTCIPLLEVSEVDQTAISIGGKTLLLKLGLAEEIYSGQQEAEVLHSPKKMN